jgi:protein dithiol:quinone oxidoreductase
LIVLKFLARFTFRQTMAFIALGCIAMLCFGFYLQHVGGLEPCPMCIVQRYAMILIAIWSIIASATGIKSIQISASWLVVITALGGAFVAARQSWLQWYPPEIVSCGRDVYGMIEMFPLQKLVPMILKGSGDCTKIDWTFLGGSIANWSFLCFCGIAAVGLWSRYMSDIKSSMQGEIEGDKTVDLAQSKY